MDLLGGGSRRVGEGGEGIGCALELLVLLGGLALASGGDVPFEDLQQRMPW